MAGHGKKGTSTKSEETTHHVGEKEARKDDEKAELEVGRVGMI
jgi:hypothetical protein